MRLRTAAIVFCAALLVGGGVLFFFQTQILLRIALKPGHSFAEAEKPPAPDYALPSSWAALPEKNDKADVRPSGEASAPPLFDADVFFIHPTTFLSRKGWNAAFNEEGALDMLEGGVMRFQASAYNLCCRVFAPRYRQATLWSFLGDEPDGADALSFAYDDVRRAFYDFLENRNQGRPFILASHSQGSLHGMRLLQEEIAGTPVAERLIAAYLIGYAIPRDMTPLISPCRSARETGCYINWNALDSSEERENWLEDSKIWLGGRITRIAGRPIACVNPLSWELGGASGAAANLGSLPASASGEPMNALLPNLTGAACESGLLIITPPETDGFSAFVRGGDYHVYDYNLFYENLRQNASLRVKAFLDK